MGILGLLQGLKYQAHQGHIRDYAGQSVAVDASSWLHKSVYSIADYYVETTETTNTVDHKCVAAATKYMVTRCQELLTHANIHTVYLVMDGKRCPLKAVTNNDRERRRQENLHEARRYKRAGQREKMYDKYKACIKVRVDLTQAVMKAVAKRFPDGRVQLVWSPYEADAQLVKLCMDGLTQAVITEDSDVLVYSVACEISFPILFKLDRKTGSCDVISMDWFLSPPHNAGAPDGSQQPTTTVDLSKKASGLEPILSTYLSRQHRDPGLGGRLFVQSCVLTGCDYSPNLLTGVGLVTAFKHMRSSIHRTSQERFTHVLKLLPRKARAHLDIVEYEELLAKSEAVFYYHPVCETDGRVVFLKPPNTTTAAVDPVDGGVGHRPNLCRFEGDWSFLGNMSSDGVLSQQMPEPGVAKLAPPKPPVSSGVMTNFFGGKRPRTEQSSAPPLPNAKRAQYAHGGGGLAKAVAEVKAMANPYNMAKKQKGGEGSRSPLLPKSPNEPDRNSKNSKNNKKPNPFALFARDKDKENTKKTGGGLERFLARHGDNDVRFVKRVFPKDGTRTLLRKAASPPTAKARLPPQSFVVDDKPSTRSKEPTDNVSLDDVLESPEPDSKMPFDYGNDDDDVYDNNINRRDTLDLTDHSARRSVDPVSAPFGNHSFHSSQRDDYGNYDDDNDNNYSNSRDTLDLTNLSSRRSLDPVSAPFENHSFHSSQRDAFGNDDDDYDNNRPRDTLDLTNLSSRRSLDRVSAPFGNHSFHSSQTDDGNQSKFFGGKRDYLRRVTEEFDEMRAPESSTDAVDSPSHAPDDSSAQQKSTFSFYGDFLSDKSASDQEEIDESSPEAKARPAAAAPSKPIVHRRPNTLMGATKKLRYRLGGKSAPVTRKPFSVGQPFRRQGAIATSTRPSAATEPRRGSIIGSKRPGSSAKKQKQNTLLSHFPLVIQDNDN